MFDNFFIQRWDLQRAARKTGSETIIEMASLLALLADDFRDLLSLHGVISLTLLMPHLADPTLPRLHPRILPAPYHLLLSRERLAKDLRVILYASGIYGPPILFPKGEPYSNLELLRHTLREGVFSDSLFFDVLCRHACCPPSVPIAARVFPRAPLWHRLRLTFTCPLPQLGSTSCCMTNSGHL